MRYAKINSNELPKVIRGRIYKAHDSGFLLDYNYNITGNTIIESSEIDYAIQEQLNLTGRYLKAIIDRPDGIPIEKGDILKITGDKSVIIICGPDFHKKTTWSFALNKSKYDLLPENYSLEGQVSLPEYVECIIQTGYLEVGAIVKCKHEDNTFKWLYETTTKLKNYPESSKDALAKGSWDLYGNNKNYLSELVQKCFKASTKEAYDAQNNSDIWIPKIGDWVVLQYSKNNWSPKMMDLVGKCVQITDISKTRKTSIKFKEITYHSWCLEDDHYRKALPHEIPSEDRQSLVEFPKEGCVYELPDNMKEFVKYLVYRPNNIISNTVPRSYAIGIGWDKKGCWWLDTPTSAIPSYSLSSLELLLNITKNMDTFKLPEKWCIKQNVHQKVCDWFRKYSGTSSANLSGSFKYLCYDKITNTTSYSKHTNKEGIDYKEITFEQFCKYVLGESVTETYINYDNDTKESREEMVKKYPYPSNNPCSEVSLPSDNGIVDLYIPEVKETVIKVDYSVSVKLVDIKLPDFSVKPEKIEVIKVESYVLSI